MGNASTLGDVAQRGDHVVSAGVAIDAVDAQHISTTAAFSSHSMHLCIIEMIVDNYFVHVNLYTFAIGLGWSSLGGKRDRFSLTITLLTLATQSLCKKIGGHRSRLRQ